MGKDLMRMMDKNLMIASFTTQTIMFIVFSILQRKLGRFIKYSLLPCFWVSEGLSVLGMCSFLLGIICALQCYLLLSILVVLCNDLVLNHCI